jgi:hypothetical protein
MAKSLRFKVHNCKLVGRNALMVFDLAVGYEDQNKFVGVMDVRGCWLKQKQDGSANFVSFPSKLRLTKEGAAAIDANGYKIYDNIVDLYMEQGANPEKPDTRSPTPAAWNWRRWLIEEATTAYDALKNSDDGRGAARASAPAPKANKPAAAPTVTEDEFEEPDEDDGFPF